MGGLTILLATGLAWFLSRALKLIIDVQKKGHFDFTLIMSDGGMPSGHTASAVGLATALYFETGFSIYFSMAIVLTLIVMTDAVRVRYVTGELAKAMNKLHIKEKSYKALRERVGHTLPEVCVGALVGVVGALTFYMLWYM